MKSNVFIYIATNFVLLQLLSLQSELVTQCVYGVCGFGILTIGIAHGSIDNILYGAKPGKANIFFILKYSLFILLFAILWMLLPNIAFVIFLGVSAYHFGQSQFIEYSFSPKLLSQGLYFAWGSMILLLLFYFNSSDLLSLEAAHLPFYTVFSHLVHYAAYYLLFAIVVYGLLFGLLFYYNSVPLQSFFKEKYIVILIACSMYILPAFVAFSIFFIWIHALKVIQQEFDFCKEKLQIKTVSSFIKLFLPLTLTALIGSVLILFLFALSDKIYLIPYVILIILSCVTLPHSFVMDKFYTFAIPK